jgi:hypothetical protein
MDQDDQVLNDLLLAAASSIGIWDNPEDDEEWNDV